MYCELHRQLSASTVLTALLHQRLQMSACESIVLAKYVAFSLQHLEAN